MNIQQVGAKKMDYAHIEEQLVERLPEIRPAADAYWLAEGRPGEDCGAYIFVEDMFAKYIEILLAVPASPKRNRLLSRAFAVLDEMLVDSDQDLNNLAFIGVFEGRSDEWLRESAPFLGPAALTELDTYSPEWRDTIAKANDALTVEAVDLYGIRALIAAELDCPLRNVPGCSP